MRARKRHPPLEAPAVPTVCYCTENERSPKDLLPILFFLAPFAQETFHCSALRNLFVQGAVFGLVVVHEDRFGIVLEDENIFLCFDGGHQFELGPGTPSTPIRTLVLSTQWTAQSFPQDADHQVEVRGKRDVLLVITSRLHRFVLPEVRLDLDSV